jgi:hypothetical protein
MAGGNRIAVRRPDCNHPASASDQFTAYFSSALQKKKVPATVTVDPAPADYTAQFQAKAKDGSLIQRALASIGTGAHNNVSVNEVAMTIVDAKSKDVFS